MKKMRNYIIHKFAAFMRKIGDFPFSERILRIIYHPDKRKNDLLETVIPFDGVMKIHINTSSFIEWTIFFRGYYEPDIVELIKKYLKPGFVAIDVGANIGAHALIMSRLVGEGGIVIGVEPLVSTVNRFQDNIKLNHLHNIHLISQALSNKVGRAELYVPQAVSNKGISSLYKSDFNITAFEKVSVILNTLDNLYQEYRSLLKRIDLIKIDTEGNDFNVIIGSEKTIELYKPIIIFEYDKSSWEKAQNSWDQAALFFEKNNYYLYGIERFKNIKKLNKTPLASLNILALPKDKAFNYKEPLFYER